MTLAVLMNHSDDQGRLLFVVEDLRLSTVSEFRVRVHPAAQLPSGWSEFLQSEMHRTLSEESGLATPVETQVTDPLRDTVPDGRDTPAVVSMADAGPVL